MKSNLKVAIHQPAYLPWLGYLDRIKESDLFIFLDTVQFEKNSFINRNKIKGPNGPYWLTIPIKNKGHLSKSINEIEIVNDTNWRKKHLKSIKSSYSKCISFQEKYDKLCTLYEGKENNIADLCFNHLLFWLTELNIKTKVIRASELNCNSKKSDLVLDLCNVVNATDYISGPMGKNYLEESKFCSSKIAIHYHDFEPTPYPQLFGDFIPFMSIADYWFNN